jgi:hypothetical protein
MHVELDNVPPVVMLVRRQDDRWLATWARAEELLMYPLDPVAAADTVAAVLRRRRAVAVRPAGSAH